MAKKQTPNVKEIRKVVMYRRISQDRENQTSTFTQEQEIRAYCQFYNYEIIGDFQDVGKSAYDLKVKRPGFDNAMSMVTSGQADAIVVWKLDRFSRSVTEFWKSIIALDEAKGHLISVIEKFDTTNPLIGRLLIMLVITFAELESATKRDRALPMHDHQKNIGAVGPGPRPYGYCKIDSKDNDGKGARLEQIKSEADLLLLAAEWVLSDGTLTGFINHYQPDSATAQKKMTYRGLKCALTNPASAGLRERNDGAYQPIVQIDKPILDRQTWDRLREILLAPERSQYVNGNKLSCLLSGFMVCECGATVYQRNWTNPKTRTITKRYMCGGCKNNSVSMAPIDDIVMAELFDRVPESKWQSWQTQGKGWDAAIVTDIQSRLTAVDRLFSQGKISESRWIDMSGDLTEQLEAAQNEEPLDIPVANNLRESWADFSWSDKQRVLAMAFEQITMVRQNGSRDPRTRIAFN